MFKNSNQKSPFSRCHSRYFKVVFWSDPWSLYEFSRDKGKRKKRYRISGLKITLPTKVHLIKAMVFPVVMFGCESWTVKKAGCWRIDAFELFGEDSRVPWTARRSNQSILKEMSPGIFLEGMMLKLKLQSFGHLMQRADSFEKTLIMGGIGGRRRRGPTEDEVVGWHHRLDGHEFGWTPGVGDRQGGLACCSSWGRKESNTTEWLNWTVNEMNYISWFSNV